VTKGGKLKRQIATNSLPPFASFLSFGFEPRFSERFRLEMVSNKITGFHIPECHQNFVRLIVSNWMMMAH